MIKTAGIALLLSVTCTLAHSQLDEIWLDSAYDGSDSSEVPLLLSEPEVRARLEADRPGEGGIILGGYVSSIYHEAIDSVRVQISIDGERTETLFTEQGFFQSDYHGGRKLVDLTFSHPDYHKKDTSLVLRKDDINIIMLQLEPRYKILLRGRVFTGNMPLEDVDVRVLHDTDEYKLTTRGCFYDREDYWNCLFNGMFKLELTSENPGDSIKIYLHKEGMKPYIYGMTFNEYQGEIMQMRMKYESRLPVIPMNDLNLKLGFPFMSAEQDWFVSLSYYRLVNREKLKRLAYGIDANMYITNITVSYPTFDGLELAEADSSYINTFLGPSVLLWIRSPEHRVLSSYVGTTLSMDLNSTTFTPQFYLASRVFLDLNKAISLEIRYCEFDRVVTHYTFNAYGNAGKYGIFEKFTKIHATLGVQVVF